MKNILLMMFVSLISSAAFAQMDYDEEIIKTNTMVYAIDLECTFKIAGGDAENTMITVLPHRGFLSSPGEDAVSLDHGALSKRGCDLEKLQKIVEDSRMQFGFVSVTQVLTRRIAKRPIIISGQCLRHHVEIITVDLGEDTVLESAAYAYLPTTGCEES